MSAKTSPSLLPYRASVLARTVLAGAGGYALSACFSAAMALAGVHWLGMSRVDAVTLATMLAFCVFTVAVIAVFAMHKGLKAALWVLVPTAGFAALTWLLQGSAA